MTAASIQALVARFDRDDDVADVRTETNTKLSIGRDVVRLRWRHQWSTAVAADADIHTTCGALLDAIALLESGGQADAGDMDTSTVNVLVDRPLPSRQPTETVEALRSMRAATVGIAARIWYRDDGRWVEDVDIPPTWPAGDPRVREWVDTLLLPRLTAQPTPLATALVEAVADPSLHLYPSEIKLGAKPRWALRLDGLQIGIVGTSQATLSIGKPGKADEHGVAADSRQRKAFIEVFGTSSVTVSADDHPPEGVLTIADAANRVRALLTRFRGQADVRGAPIAHRLKGGVPIIDEHTVEARLLKGVTRLADVDERLVLDDEQVARGSQFPTLWGHAGKARYLDALVRRDTTPIAVELKVATGGQGRYYRRSLIQAVLYRHFIRNADDLDQWFVQAGLDRAATEGCIGVPIPTRWTPGFTHDLQLLRRVAARVGAQVHLLDDRATPDLTVADGLPEADGPQCELHSWRLAAALSHRWPTTLGRVVETHECGGFYYQLQLQSINDRSLDVPSPRPRISLNRPGSAWVLSHVGTSRWTWRGIWTYLANGGDVDAAAVTLGAIAGLGPPEQSAPDLCFAQLAAAFLEGAGPEWSWRCAWTGENGIAPWLERFRVPVQRYARHASKPGAIPTIARIWGAIRHGEAALVVDQENLRAWVLDKNVCREVFQLDLIDQLVASAQVASAQVAIA